MQETRLLSAAAARLQGTFPPGSSTTTTWRQRLQLVLDMFTGRYLYMYFKGRQQQTEEQQQEEQEGDAGCETAPVAAPR